MLTTLGGRVSVYSLSRYLIPYLLVYFLLFVVWFLLPAYSQLVIYIAFYIALGQAFNIFLGFTNYVCFGYVAFMAMGMYGMALTVKWLNASAAGTSLSFLGLVFGGYGLSIIMSVVLAVAVGIIALRLREAYFAIATIGLSQGFRFLIEGSGIWGGSGGLIISRDIITLFGYSGLTLVSTVVADVLVLTTGMISLTVTYLITHSRLGYALQAVKEDEDVAKVFGVNATKYKLIAFTVSAALAGMLGAAKLLKDQAVFPPEAFSISYTVEAIIIVLLGGRGTLIGPIIGGIVYGSLKYYLTALLPGLQLLILAPVLIAIVLAFPAGIVGWLKKRFKGALIDRIFI